MKVLAAIVTLCAFAAAASACGRKAPPRPPEFVRPRTIADLAARPVRDGIRLTWTRPTTTMDGKTMRDLGGFVISRAAKGGAAPAFAPIATIELDDRARFRKVREMTYDDRAVSAGEPYLYRVVAFTLDRYVSAPSRIAEATWPGPAAAPAEPEADAVPGGPGPEAPPEAR